MAEQSNLNKPWLVAVWPGMGGVASSAGYYLMSKLGMHQLAEFSPRDLFDIEYIDVQGGIIHPGRLPRSRFFVWKDPEAKRDILVFIGEAQPPIGKHAFCHRMIQFAQQLDVQRVVTFAAMATGMHPEHDARTFAAATSEDGLAELRSLNTEILEKGRIGGLNGALLGVAAEDGLDGVCLLGEMPHVFAQLPNPKAAYAVLETFCRLAGVHLDLAELKQQADQAGVQLGKLLGNVEQMMRQHAGDGAAPAEAVPDDEESGLDPGDRQHIETLFEQARQDRSKAYELKAELDRLKLFDKYEDRFLDLFRSS
ncbi:PAC2 family protein [Coraliomargarita parva]|uniref:PAC2 family protein n=1 Tax=Coraliomargarita parva TaxID=3014050 RepID=UPI0022B50C09|nr:PAC2 family protein [Coraliomargarita parva]